MRFFVFLLGFTFSFYGGYFYCFSLACFLPGQFYLRFSFEFCSHLCIWPTSFYLPLLVHFTQIYFFILSISPLIFLILKFVFLSVTSFPRIFPSKFWFHLFKPIPTDSLHLQPKESKDEREREGKKERKKEKRKKERKWNEREKKRKRKGTKEKRKGKRKRNKERKKETKEQETKEKKRRKKKRKKMKK